MCFNTIFLVIISEFMPIRSAGNFFSTFNSTIFFIFLAVVANAKRDNTIIDHMKL